MSELHEHPAFQGLPVSPISAAQAVRTLARYDPVIRAALRRGDVPSAVSKAFTSRWANISKAVTGGFSHVISADSGAYYAELWSSGKGPDANWYAVTGAGIHEVDTIRKGEGFGTVFPKFLDSTVAKSEGCKPCAER